jgi:hypothetical protein
MKTTTTAKCREWFLNKYPALRENEAYRRMMMYLMFAPQLRGSNKVPLSYEIVSMCADQVSQAISKHFNAVQKNSKQKQGAFGRFKS